MQTLASRRLSKLIMTTVISKFKTIPNRLEKVSGKVDIPIVDNYQDHVFRALIF